MAKEIKFSTGVEEFRINGVPVRFNPTDTAFVERMHKVFDDLSGKQDEFQRRIDEIGEDGAAMFAYAAERDGQMRDLIDGLFGGGTADALFPDMNCYALADGLPAWINLMFAVAEEVDAAFSAEQKKSDPRIRGYTKKYEAMRRKYRRK